jgi:hypothetical protein
VVKGEKAVVESNGIAGPKEVSPELAERIQLEMFQRQSWPSYQEMLVRSFRRSYRSFFTV